MLACSAIVAILIRHTYTIQSLYMEISGILSDESIAAYWAQLDPEAFSAIGKMSEVDQTWSMDSVPIVLQACEELGKKLTSQSVMSAAASDQRLLNTEDIKMTIEVMSSLQSTRGLRIFRWLEQYQPEFSTELVEAATQMQDDHSALLFLERMRVLNKLHLISRIFSYNRLKMIIDRLSEIKSSGKMDRIIEETETEQREHYEAELAENASVEKEVEDYVADISKILSADNNDDDDDKDGW